METRVFFYDDERWADLMRRISSGHKRSVFAIAKAPKPCIIEETGDRGTGGYNERRTAISERKRAG